MEEKRLCGSPVSDGIAIGKAFFLPEIDEEPIPEFIINSAKVEMEVERFRNALSSSRQELESIHSQLQQERGGKEAALIIDTHIQILQDPLITEKVEDRIRERRRNTESVFRTVMREYEDRFQGSFQERITVDLRDLSTRIMGHLMPRCPFSFRDLSPNSVVFARSLATTDTAAAELNRAAAFVTQRGGGNSHAALVARARGIPFVSDINIQELQSYSGMVVIVNGTAGQIILNPTAATLEEHRILQTQMQTTYASLERERTLPACTKDGIEITLQANVGNLEELLSSKHHLASGVGLFRTEQLLLADQAFIYSEESQYALYRKMVEQLEGAPLTLRVFDIGGDKNPHLFYEHEKEENPLLGCRGIRFLLRREDLLKIQLRAALRTSAHGALRLLFPLISDLEELRGAKRLLEQAKIELLQENKSFDSNVPIGCMMEVPSAILIADHLAKETDYFSLGTNDLIQYTLGIDRANPSMQARCSAHPSIVRLIQTCVETAALYKKPLSVCGEVASNPLFVPLLIGLGVREFSVAPHYLPFIKQAVRYTDSREARLFAKKVLACDTADGVVELLRSYFTGLLPSAIDKTVS